MLEAPEEVASEDVDLGNRPRSPGIGLVEAFGLNPIADPKGHVVDYPSVEHVPNRRVIELAQGLSLAEEPGSQLVVAGKVHSDRDPPVEELVAAHEQHPFGGGGDQSFEAISISEAALGGAEERGGLE
jgi:hypothetical protein